MSPCLDLRAQAEAFLDAFRALGSPERSKGQKAYLKSDLNFCGVTAADLRSTAKTFKREHPALEHDELTELVGELWRTRWHELRSVAIALLELYPGLLGPSDLVLIEELLRRSRTWAFVDWLSIHIAGPIVEGWPETAAVLERWAVDDDFWIRRSAMLALLLPLRRGGGDFQLFTGFASSMIEEKEFFIRKAIGWVLREVSKKRPRLSHAFLTRHVATVSGLTLREGAKYLPPDQREDLLKRYRER
jgi:3-methyladenine DNA glycosylase AlkD